MLHILLTSVQFRSNAKNCSVKYLVFHSKKQRFKIRRYFLSARNYFFILGTDGDGNAFRYGTPLAEERDKFDDMVVADLTLPTFWKNWERTGFSEVKSSLKVSKSSQEHFLFL